MPSVCLYLEAHLPLQLRPYSVFETDHQYFDFDQSNITLQQFAHRILLPTCATLFELRQRFHDALVVAFGISGTLLQQASEHQPEILNAINRLHTSAAINLTAHTWSSAPVAAYDALEFANQVVTHANMLAQHFATRPKRFAQIAERHPAAAHRLTQDNITPPLATEIITPDLSVDCAALAQAVANRATSAGTLTLGIPLHTLARSPAASNHLTTMLRGLISNLIERHQITLVPFAELSDRPTRARHDDEPEWISSELQRSALATVYAMQTDIYATDDTQLLQTWRQLQSIEHFLFMGAPVSTSIAAADAQPEPSIRLADPYHSRIASPFDSPYDAYITYMTILDDLARRCARPSSK